MSFRTVAFILCYWLTTITSASALSYETYYKTIPIRSFSPSIIQPEIVYAVAARGVFKSTDSGVSWTPLKLPAPRVNGLIVMPGEPEQLVAYGGGRLGEDYFISKDAGKSWTTHIISNELKPISTYSGSFAITEFLIDSPQIGGTWWAVANKWLWRSQDEGKTWGKSLEFDRHSFSDWHRVHMRTAISTHFLLVLNKFYVSKDRGNTWSLMRDFGDDGLPNFHIMTELLVFNDGRAVVRAPDGWMQSSDGGTTWEPALGFEVLPNNQSKRIDASRREQTDCRVSQDAMHSTILKASCLTKTMTGNYVRAHPARYESNDEGRTWAPIDQPEVAVWPRSDIGLRFPRLATSEQEMVMGARALNEPPLFQAVMFRDWEKVKFLIANGADVNAPGNYFKSVLEADVYAASETNQYPPSIYYKQLLELGAIPLTVLRTHQGVLAWEWATAMRLTDFLDTLVESGYDWGGDSSDYMPTSEFKSSIRSSDQGSKEIAGRPLAKWIDLYIKASKFPSVDQTIKDLIDIGEKRLAMKVTIAASKKKRVDRKLKHQEFR